MTNARLINESAFAFEDPVHFGLRVRQGMLDLSFGKTGDHHDFLDAETVDFPQQEADLLFGREGFARTGETIIDVLFNFKNPFGVGSEYAP